jgi:ferric-dicitrate binding protein FerR (iron transport regulator)
LLFGYTICCQCKKNTDSPPRAGRIHSCQPDEIVRLFGGTLTVRVDPLRSNERFRIVTGDALVEVKGAVFDVTATEDRLTSVRVISGIVEVRPSG